MGVFPRTWGGAVVSSRMVKFREEIIVLLVLVVLVVLKVLLVALALALRAEAPVEHMERKFIP